MLAELLEVIQIGKNVLQAGKDTMDMVKDLEDLYDGEHCDAVEKAYEMAQSLDVNDHYEEGVREILDQLSVIDKNDRDFVKAAAYDLRARCYYDLGDYTKARQDITACLNIQIDSFTLEKDRIREFQASAEQLLEEIKSSTSTPFSMPVEDVFYIQGKGTIITGKIESGRIKVGNPIFLVKGDVSITTTVLGIEMFRKLLNEAECGDNVGLLLDGVSKEQVVEGMVASSVRTKAEVTSSSPKETNCATVVPPAVEQEYIDELKECLADGEIGAGERRLLGKLAAKLGITPERAAELEASLAAPALSDNEKEYLEEFKAAAVDGVVSEKERRLLDKLKKMYGISDERAKEIEYFSGHLGENNITETKKETSFSALTVGSFRRDIASMPKLNHYRIDPDICVACGTCLGECPAGAISEGEKDSDAYSIDSVICVSCGICADSCPMGAISNDE